MTFVILTHIPPPPALPQLVREQLEGVPNANLEQGEKKDRVKDKWMMVEAEQPSLSCLCQFISEVVALGTVRLPVVWTWDFLFAQVLQLWRDLLVGSMAGLLTSCAQNENMVFLIMFFMFLEPSLWTF